MKGFIKIRATVLLEKYKQIFETLIYAKNTIFSKQYSI